LLDTKLPANAPALALLSNLKNSYICCPKEIFVKNKKKRKNRNLFLIKKSSDFAPLI
jgi:hypothetical protein